MYPPAMHQRRATLRDLGLFVGHGQFASAAGNLGQVSSEEVNSFAPAITELL
jgi:hypothetical protein